MGTGVEVHREFSAPQPQLLYLEYNKQAEKVRQKSKIKFVNNIKYNKMGEKKVPNVGTRITARKQKEIFCA